MNSNRMTAGKIFKKYNLLILLILFTAIAALISDRFLQMNNFLNIMRSASFGGIIALGMTFAILIGGIDLSVGYMANFSGMVCAYLLVSGVPIPFAILAAIVAGAILGTVSGVVINYFHMPAFIATLAMLMIAQGLSLFVSSGNVINNLPEAFNNIGSAKLFGKFPLVAFIWIVLTVIAALVLKYTPFGRRLYSLGGNPEAAYLSGIKIKKYSIISYIICASLAALSGILMSSYLSVGQPTAIQAGETDAIAAVVIGGTSMAGGIGGVVGTFGGVILLQIITNIFNLIGVAPFFQYIFKGVIIILALILNNFVVGNKKSD